MACPSFEGATGFYLSVVVTLESHTDVQVTVTKAKAILRRAKQTELGLI